MKNGLPDMKHCRFATGDIPGLKGLTNQTSTSNGAYMATHTRPSVFGRFLLTLLVSYCLPGTSHALTPVSIPLDRADGWQVLEYSGIPPHDIDFTPDGMTIAVRQSASPVIFPIEPQIVTTLKVSAEITGVLRLKPFRQGDKGNDDFLFRVGLVYEGEQTLNFIQRSFAAKWIKVLFDLAPRGTGVERIQFYNAYSDPLLTDTVRVHPLSKLMSEHFITYVPEAIGNEFRTIQFEVQPETDRRVLALWISSDGDDTKSSFRVKIREIKLQ